MSDQRQGDPPESSRELARAIKHLAGAVTKAAGPITVAIAIRDFTEPYRTIAAAILIASVVAVETFTWHRDR